MPDSRDPEPGRFDLAGATLSAGALLFLVYGIIEAPERGWLDPFTLGCAGVAAALGLAFLWWEHRTPEPMLDLRLFRRARFALGAVAISLACFSLLGAMFSLTQFLQSALGYSALEAGAAMTPIALGMVLGAGSGRPLDAAARHRQGRRRRADRARRDAAVRADLVAVDAVLADRGLVPRARRVGRLDHGRRRRTP